MHLTGRGRMRCVSVPRVTAGQERGCYECPHHINHLAHGALGAHRIIHETAAFLLHVGKVLYRCVVGIGAVCRTCDLLLGNGCAQLHHLQAILLLFNESKCAIRITKARIYSFQPFFECAPVTAGNISSIVRVSAGI